MQQVLAAPGGADDEAVAGWYAFGPGATLRSNMIMSADGAAIGPDGLSKGLSGSADRRLLGILRALADAVVVGAGTLRDEHYHPVRTRDSLAAMRAAAGMAAHPTLVMITREPKRDRSLRALAGAPVRPLVLCARRSAALDDVADVVALPNAAGGVDLAQAKEFLVDRGLLKLHTEGGPHLLAGFLQQGLLDEYCVTIAPRALGGSGVLRPVDGPAADTGFVLGGAAEADGYLFLHYRRPR